MLLYIGFALAMSSATVGQKCELVKDRADLPSSPNLLRFVSGTAGILCFVHLYLGLQEGWLVPVFLILTGFAFYALWLSFLYRLINPIAFSMLTGLASMAATAAFVFG